MIDDLLIISRIIQLSFFLMPRNPDSPNRDVTAPIRLPGKKKAESVPDYFYRRLKQAEPGKNKVPHRRATILELHTLFEAASPDVIGTAFADIQTRIRKLMGDLELVRSDERLDFGDFARAIAREDEGTAFSRELGVDDFRRAVRDASNR